MAQKAAGTMRRESAEARVATVPPDSAPIERRSRRRNSFLPTAIGISGGVALASVAFWFFRQQAKRVVEGEADAYDTKILTTVQTAQSPALDKTMHLVTQLGTHVAIGAAAGITALVMIRQKRRHDGWTVLIS